MIYKKRYSLNISQYSQENVCAVVSFSLKVQAAGGLQFC